MHAVFDGSGGGGGVSNPPPVLSLMLLLLLFHQFQTIYLRLYSGPQIIYNTCKWSGRLRLETEQGDKSHGGNGRERHKGDVNLI